MRPAPKEFLDSLRPDDFVAARVFSSSKLHLVRIKRRVTRDMLRLENTLTDEERSQLFDAKVICKANPRYWWKPTHDVDAYATEDRCSHCFQIWRSTGRPAIKGWRRAEQAVVTSSVRLPFGWAEVEPVGHPLDLPADAPDPEPDEKEQQVGAKRVEVRRWLRGSRYVRITRSLVDGRFTSRYGAIGDKPNVEGWWLTGGWDAVLPAAVTLMALGGTRSNRTKYDVLKLKDVTVQPAPEDGAQGDAR